MCSSWKALSDNNGRQILLLFKNKDIIPTQIADQLEFTLPAVSTNLRILKESDLITEKKKGKNSYSLNRSTTSELAQYFHDLYDDKLKSLKEYVENKVSKERMG